jgi:RNA polymerase sigma-32 factor
MTAALSLPMNNAQLVPTAGSLTQYIQSVNAVPLLSAEEEDRLARRFRDENDIEAARRLVLSHLRFVVRVARGYEGYGLQLSDLIQEGNIGLMKAVKRFDPDVGVRLVSFAVHWIRAEIHEFVIRNWRIVKVATTKAQRKLFFNLRKAKRRLGWLSREEVEAVARDLDVSPDDVLEMEKRLSAYDATFDPAPDADEDHMFAPAAYLEDLREEPSALLENEQGETLRLEALRSALESLTPRSRDIVERRWLAEPKTTLQILADEYGVSAERIRQLEAAAMKQLKAKLDTPLLPSL